jgi:FtsH-binding integral membrane protein
MTNRHPESQILATVRKILLVTSVASMAGAAVELILLNHLTPLLQLIPVMLIALGLGSLLWYGISRNTTSMRIFQGTMFLCVISGFLGIVVHIAFSAADATKKDKTLHGMNLLHAALTGVAPALAPGTMIEIGLVGLAYTYRHPVLEDAALNESPVEGK